MTFRQFHRSPIRRVLTRIGLVFSTVVVALGLTVTGATAAVGSGVKAADFTLSQSNWSPGDNVSLYPGYLLTFQGDGNLVLYKYNSDSTVTPLWASGTSGSGVTQIDWSQAGYAKLQNSSGTTLCTLGALSPAPGGQAVMQYDGNFVFYNTSGSATWATGTYNGQQGNLNYCYS